LQRHPELVHLRFQMLRHSETKYCAGKLDLQVCAASTGYYHRGGQRIQNGNDAGRIANGSPTSTMLHKYDCCGGSGLQRELQTGSNLPRSFLAARRDFEDLRVRCRYNGAIHVLAGSGGFHEVRVFDATGRHHRSHHPRADPSTLPICYFMS